jgi:hypothetical protein
MQQQLPAISIEAVRFVKPKSIELTISEAPNTIRRPTINW